MDIITLAAAKSFATKVSAGYSNVSVSGQTITFTLNDGTKTSLTVPTPADGVSVKDLDIDSSNHLLVELSNGNIIDAGEIATIKGDKGNTGDKGDAATIAVGTVTSGDTVSVTNSGTSSDAIFDFVLKQGDKGDKGDTGEEGFSPTATVTKDGKVATITITDKNGTTTATITDGEGGGTSGAVIDDDTTTATDETWSANKIYTYVNDQIGSALDGSY